MVNIKIDNQIYLLPMGEVYKDSFSNFILDDIISFDNIDVEELYKQMNLLFEFVTNSLVVMGTDDYPLDLIEEKKYILSNMAQIDNLQKFFASKGHYEKSINIIKEFLVKMLIHHKKLIDSDEKVEMGL